MLLARQNNILYQKKKKVVFFTVSIRNQKLLKMTYTGHAVPLLRGSLILQGGALQEAICQW